MPVLMSDETLQMAKMTEQEMVVEVACLLFDAGKLALWPAAKMAGMERFDFEQELFRRKISVYRPTVADVMNDVAALERLGI